MRASAIKKGVQTITPVHRRRRRIRHFIALKNGRE